MRVAIIGGGVMGCTTALALGLRGADVVVLERAVPGAEASSAAAGILGAQVELHGPGDDAARFIEARGGWRGWADALREITGIDVGYRESGTMRVAFTEEERAGAASEVEWQSREGLRASLLDAKAARAVEPELSEAVVAASHFPDDAQVDPPALLRALMAALAKSARVGVRAGTTVRALIVERDRCVGVALEDGEVRADATVLAAGSWSSLVPGVPVAMATVRPCAGRWSCSKSAHPR
jgi:glycine oxidase